VKPSPQKNLNYFLVRHEISVLKTSLLFQENSAGLALKTKRTVLRKFKRVDNAKSAKTRIGFLTLFDTILVDLEWNERRNF
jgi:hypothetical protein